MWPHILHVELEEQANQVSENEMRNLLPNYILPEIFWGEPNGFMLCALARAGMHGDRQSMARHKFYTQASVFRLFLEENSPYIKIWLSIAIGIFYFFISWTTFFVVAALNIAIDYYLRKIEIESKVRNRIREDRY